MESLLQLNLKEPTIEQLNVINKTLFEAKVMLGDESLICRILFRLRNSYEILLHGYTASRHLYAVSDKSLINDPAEELFQIKVINSEEDCLKANDKSLLKNAINFICEKYGNESDEIVALSALITAQEQLSRYVNIVTAYWCVEEPDFVEDSNNVLKQIDPYIPPKNESDNEEAYEWVQVFNSNETGSKTPFAARFVKRRKQI
jgi:hypothetical protein